MTVDSFCSTFAIGLSANTELVSIRYQVCNLFFPESSYIYIKKL